MIHCNQKNDNTIEFQVQNAFIYYFDFIVFFFVLYFLLHFGLGIVLKVCFVYYVFPVRKFKKRPGNARLKNESSSSS